MCGVSVASRSLSGGGQQYTLVPWQGAGLTASVGTLC